MNKYIKNLILILFFSLFFIGCTKPDENGGNLNIHECLDNESDWIDDEPFTCLEKGSQHTICTICGEIISTRTYTKRHDYSELEIVKEATCTENGLKQRTCANCGKVDSTVIHASGHERGKIEIAQASTSSTLGKKNVLCSKCNGIIKTLNYVNNGFQKYGKLEVDGRDLVGKSGTKVQLYGLSTHGMQWFGRYANFDTIASIQESFGNNIIRFAFYTSEDGYCDGNESRKKQMLEDLIEGVDAATSLGLYVIIDWHMVGAEDVLDKNPLTYLEESKEFFSYISNYYRNQNNILYEIMNEPNGSTTWSDCKKYAEQVIPCIRKNSDGIILVGNPRWTADLNSVMKDPLVGFDNIMYTYHFYAGDHRSTTQVEKAYDSGFPVFISEFGFMDSDGDGNLNLTSGENWKTVLDKRNISYVAWNISNSGGSASIFKQGSDDMIDVSDSNLKEWGVYLKKWYRSKSGIDMINE